MCEAEKTKSLSRWSPVQVTAVRQDSIRRIVTRGRGAFSAGPGQRDTEDQRAGSQVLCEPRRSREARQLLAELENRDLAAAAAASKGQFEQAEANYRSHFRRLGSRRGEQGASRRGVRRSRRWTPPNSCWRAAKDCSRKARWRADWSMRRRSRSRRRAASMRPRGSTCAALQAVGRQEQIQRLGRPGGGGTGASPGRRGATRLFADPQSHSRRRYGPSALCRRNGERRVHLC